MLSRLVSKTRIRFSDEDFDLDLSYITNRIIAMAYPETGMGRFIRNSMEEVERFLNTRHQDKYRVYNLTTKEYDSVGRFEGRVIQLKIIDHTAPPFFDACALIEDMAIFLEADPNNVVVVHCQAGKGRTGTIVSCLLLRLGIVQTADEAIEFFALRRSTDGAARVENASQVRFVRSYEKLRRSSQPDYCRLALDGKLPRYRFV